MTIMMAHSLSIISTMLDFVVSHGTSKILDVIITGLQIYVRSCCDSHGTAILCWIFVVKVMGLQT